MRWNLSIYYYNGDERHVNVSDLRDMGDTYEYEIVGYPETFILVLDIVEGVIYNGDTIYGGDLYHIGGIQ